MDFQSKALASFGLLLDIYEESIVLVGQDYGYNNLASIKKSIDSSDSPKRLKRYYKLVFEELPALRELIKVDTKLKFQQFNGLIEVSKDIISPPIDEESDLSTIFSTIPEMIRVKLKEYEIIM